MRARFRSSRSAVEALESRRLMSTDGDFITAYGDFNNDGREDKAEITSPTTVTVSLLNADGSYSVSATLTGAKNQQITGIFVGDSNNDGNLDVSGGGGSGGPKFSSTVWLGNGDGTFRNSKTVNSHPYNHGGF